MRVSRDPVVGQRGTPDPSASSGRAPMASVVDFDFRFDLPHRVLGAPFGITPASTGIRVSDTELDVWFGPWSVSTPVANIEGVKPTGPFGLARSAGPARWSIADHGLTFASSGRTGLCICFRDPVTGLEPTGTLRHPGLTVTVDDVLGLAEAICRRCDAVCPIAIIG
jgi:hypothetical protein